MAETNGPTAQLCRWVDTTKHQDIPEEVRQESVTLLYDQLGGMIASAPLPSCRPVADLAAKLGGAGQCSIVGLPQLAIEGHDVVGPFQTDSVNPEFLQCSDYTDTNSQRQARQFIGLRVERVCE